eukprot:ctg_2636.g583
MVALSDSTATGTKLPPSLYLPFRTLGVVTSDGRDSPARPLAYELGGEPFVIVPLGRCLQLFDGRTLHLLGVSTPLPHTVTAVAHLGRERLAVAAGTSVWVLERLRVQAQLPPVHAEPVTGLLSLGNGVLVSVSRAERRAVVYNRDNAVCGDMRFGVADWMPTGLMLHPPTYLNKILMAGADGRVQLVNVRTCQIVHTFDFGSAVTSMAASPAADIIAVGTAAGGVQLHHLRLDRALAQFTASAASDTARMVDRVVSAVAFRVDAPQTHPHLVSLTDDGTLQVWDLGKQRRHARVAGVHIGACRYAAFYAAEPLMVSVGDTDNYLKLHLFDSLNGEPRVLKARTGHCAPPRRVRFVGDDYRQLLTAGGADRQLRVVSTIAAHHNRELSQKALSSRRAPKRARQASHTEVGGVEPAVAMTTADGSADDSHCLLRLPPVLEVDTSDARRHDPEFANCVSCHVGRREAYTWRYESNALFRHVLVHHADEDVGQRAAAATCVAISACGNFAAVGLSSGHIDLFNLQSGSHRRRLPMAHVDGGVAGVAFAGGGGGDALASVGARDRRLKVFGEYGKRLAADIRLPGPASRVLWSRTTDLLAVVCDHDFSVRVYDAMTQRCVRVLRGHRARITDASFNHAGDGRQLLSVSMDGTLRTWDLPSGRCLDVLCMEAAPTSVAASPRGDFVVTTHVGRLGVSLWLNRAFYATQAVLGNMTAAVGDAKMCRAILSRPVSLPELVMRPADAATNDALEGDGAMECLEWPVAEDANLVTLACVPETLWVSLTQLEAIRERNAWGGGDQTDQPMPFAVQAAQGPEWATATAPDTASASTAPTPFLQAIRRGDIPAAAAVLRDLPPAAVDVELRTVPPTDYAPALQYFNERLSTRTDFELVQAHLRVFLDEHAEALAASEELAEAARRCYRELEAAWAQADELLSRISFWCHFLRTQ